MNTFPPRFSGRRGFTLVELMVSMAVLVVLAMVLVSMTDQTSRTWRLTRSKVEQFQEARNAYETVTRRLTQATLNTHWDYRYTTRNAGATKIKIPAAYVRESELRFRSGPMEDLAPGNGVYRPTHGVFFQAPFGVAENPEYASMDNLLNTWGYFLEVDDDEDLIPPFLKNLKDVIPPRRASRLMELREPTEALRIYEMPLGSNDATWFRASVNAPERPVRVVAENIVALVFLPRLSQAVERKRTADGKDPWLVKDYKYDTTLSDPDPELNPKNQLPPTVQVVMVAIDRLSAQRLAEKNGTDPDLGIKEWTDGRFENVLQLEDDPGSSEVSDGDLWKLEQELLENNLSYRVFNSNVVIRGARWSVSEVKE